MRKKSSKIDEDSLITRTKAYLFNFMLMMFLPVTFPFLFILLLKRQQAGNVSIFKQNM